MTMHPGLDVEFVWWPTKINVWNNSEDKLDSNNNNNKPMYLRSLNQGKVSAQCYKKVKIGVASFEVK
jgi:hypothetical protein